MSFCTYCGKENVKEWTGEYESETGEKSMKEVCPDNPCGHGSGHVGVKFRRWTFPLFASDDMRCKRCGTTWSSY